MSSFKFKSEFAVTLPPTVRSPVDGLNVNFVDETFSVDIEPLVALVNVTYLVEFVVVSSVMVMPLLAAS